MYVMYVVKLHVCHMYHIKCGIIHVIVDQGSEGSRIPSVIRSGILYYYVGPQVFNGSGILIYMKDTTCMYITLFSTFYCEQEHVPSKIPRCHCTWIVPA
jgi:hypothetical protein